MGGYVPRYPSFRGRQRALAPLTRDINRERKVVLKATQNISIHFVGKPERDSVKEVDILGLGLMRTRLREPNAEDRMTTNELCQPRCTCALM
jgi:hypothetical protein